jgi:CTP:molybdopterin cytidylyltransferase MocA
MGTPKAALPLGTRGATVLSQGVFSLLAAGVPRVVVVAGAHVDAVRASLVAGPEAVRIVENPGWQQGQLSSLLAGLEAVDDPQLEAILMTLVDVPLVSPDTTRRLIRTWRERGAAIVRPARGDEHGHPVLFDRRLFDALRGADPARGAKPVVHAHADDTINLPVDDEGAFLDLDTPEDYQRVLARSLTA